MPGRRFDLDDWIYEKELDPVPVPQPDAKLTATGILNSDNDNEEEDMPTDIPEHDPVHYRKPRWWAIGYALLAAFTVALVFHYFR